MHDREKCFQQFSSKSCTNGYADAARFSRMNFDIVITPAIRPGRFEFQPGGIIIGDILSVRVQQIEDIHVDTPLRTELITNSEVKQTRSFGMNGITLRQFPGTKEAPPKRDIKSRQLLWWSYRSNDRAIRLKECSAGYRPRRMGPGYQSR